MAYPKVTAILVRNRSDRELLEIRMKPISGELWGTVRLKPKLRGTWRRLDG